MEEVKQECGKEGMCACQAHKMACAGNMHRFCFKGCCAMRVLLAVVVLGGVFVAGITVGHISGREEFGERGFYRHHMMMGNYQGMYQGEAGYQNVQYQRMPMNVRVVTPAPTTAVNAASSTGTK